MVSLVRLACLVTQASQDCRVRMVPADHKDLRVDVAYPDLQDPRAGMDPRGKGETLDRQVNLVYRWWEENLWI